MNCPSMVEGKSERLQHGGKESGYFDGSMESSEKIDCDGGKKESLTARWTGKKVGCDGVVEEKRKDSDGRMKQGESIDSESVVDGEEVKIWGAAWKEVKYHLRLRGQKKKVKILTAGLRVVRIWIVTELWRKRK